jgi:hypothetical protein
MPLESEDTIPDELKETSLKLFMVMSSIGDRLYGPFSTYSDAIAFAEASDGSPFECTARLVDIKEV